MNAKRVAFVSALILILIVSASMSMIAYTNVWAQDGGRVDAPDIPLRVMVPHPDVAAKMKEDGETLLSRFPNMDPEKAFAFGPKMDLPIGRAAPATPFRTLAILVEFTDNPAATPGTYFDDLLFDNGSPFTLRSYYLEASHGILDIVTVPANLPGTLGWQIAPQTYAYYVNGANCTGTYPQNCQRLTEDLVALLNPVVDFSQYDNDGDGWVDTVFVIHAGPGAEANGGDPDMIWSHSWITATSPLVDGVRVGSYTTEPEFDNTPGDMTHGVYAHELGHAFGLPDFYDVDYSSMGIGDWGLMGGGSWNGPGNNGGSPALPTAYSREFLEFSTVVNITGAYGLYTADNVQASAANVIYRIDTGQPDEYWLIENRQQTGHDTYLPGNGLLIWHVDDDINVSNRYECTNHQNYNCPVQHFTLALEQADGTLDLEFDVNQGDAGDPFPGATNNRDFTFNSTPNTTSYFTNADTNTAIHTISPSAASMTFIYGPALLPRVSVGDVAQVETDAGTTIFTFPVTLDMADTATITVQVDTADGTATLADNDYVAVTAHIVTFVAGDTNETVTVTVNGDTTPEADEIFYVNLSNVTGNAIIDDGQGEGTILDDETPDCTQPILSASALDYCINWANVTSPGPDTLELGGTIVYPVALTYTIDSPITIDGLATYALDGGGSYRVLEVTGTGNLTLLDVVIQNGSAAGGSGVYVDTGTLTVNGGAFLDNTGVTNDGAAIFSYNGTVVIDGTIFTGNHALNAGGAIATNGGGTLSITGAAFTNNTVDSGGAGGAIFANVNDLDVVNTTFTSNNNTAVYINLGTQNDFVGCTFTNNTGPNGGAIRSVSAANFTVADSVFTGNTSTSWGGAIYNGGDLTVTNTTFANNTANGIGGGAIFSFDPLVVDGCTFVNNTAVSTTYGGGAIFSADTLTISNSTFSGNTALGGDGGAIFEYFGVTINIRTTTFSGNVASASGSALGSSSGTGTFNLASVIMEDAGAANDCEAGPTYNDLGYNLSDDGSCGLTTGNNTPNIDLDLLADNGGPTQTHALQATSAAIGQVPLGTTVAIGDLCVVGGQDQRGWPRPNPAGGPCDIGAYEYDTLPELTIDDVTVAEGDSGTVTATFTITASKTWPVDITVQVDTADGTATVADNDYVAITAQTATITAGNLTTTVEVTINGDNVVELDETYFVNLTNPTNATIADAQGVGTITNDDSATVSIANVAQAEGDAGTTAFTFTVTLTNAVDAAVTMNYSTTDDTATVVDNDYVGALGLPFSIPAGSTSNTLTITVNGDTKVELNEVFGVTLSALAAGGRDVTFVNNTAQGTITNDDSATVNIAGVAQAEGDAGTTAFTFTVTLTNAVDAAVTMNYSTTDDTATVVDNDYVGALGLPFSIPAGSTSNTLTITVNGDTKVELNEVFGVTLSALAAGGRDVTFVNNTAQGTIINDDSATISIGDVSQVEGDSGNTTFAFSITLSSPVDFTVGVDTIGYTHGTTAAGDFIGVWVSGGVDLFAPGVQAATWNVDVVGDTTVELDETFFVNLATVLAGGRDVTFADADGQGTILNDDSATLTIDDVTVDPEGNTGATNAIFTVTLNGAVDVGFTVDFATANNTALQPGDYTANSGTLNFAGTNGETQTITVAVQGDTLDEADETYYVNLSNLVIAGGRDVTIADAQGVGTIVDDDPAPTVSINDVTQAEDAGAMVFTLTLSAVSGQDVQVTATTADGTAIAGTDYTSVGQVYTITAGNLTTTVSVPITADGMDEADETYTVNLSVPVNATIADGVGEGTIVDDDPAPTVSINDVAQAEDAGAMVFTLTLSAVSGQDVQVTATTADGTAFAGTDYTAVSQVYTITAGNLTTTVSVPITAEGTIEGDETFTVNLTVPVNVTIADPQGTGTILNDDYPTLSINDVTQVEGQSGTTTFAFTVTLSQSVPFAVTVNVATADGTATVGDGDYVAASAIPLTFAPTVTTMPFNVTVNGDMAYEPDETFVVNLSGASGATIADAQGVGTITNDDLSPPTFVWTGGPVTPGCNEWETLIPVRITNMTPGMAPGYTFEVVVYNGAGEYYMDQTFTQIPTGPTVDFSIYLFADHTLGLTPTHAWPIVDNPVHIQAQLWDGTHTLLYSTFTLMNYDCAAGTHDAPTIVP